MSDRFISGFAPLTGNNPHTLILGSIPGVTSLRAQEYYAHPRNVFWSILCDYLQIDHTLNYQTRCDALTQAHIALWDMLSRCERSGSLDSAISSSSQTQIPLNTFLEQHSNIHKLLFNGKKSYQIFQSHLIKTIIPTHLTIIQLPSTSPAYAAMSYQDKRKEWLQALSQGTNQK